MWSLLVEQADMSRRMVAGVAGDATGRRRIAGLPPIDKIGLTYQGAGEAGIRYLRTVKHLLDIIH